MSARLFGIEDALDSDAWYTPEWIFDGLGLTFDLDVAHHRGDRRLELFDRRPLPRAERVDQ